MAGLAALPRLDLVIPVKEQPEPTKASGFDFHHEVYERGEDAIRQLAGLPPLRKWKGRKVKARVAGVDDVTGAMLREYDHWTRAMPALHAAYRGYCAYHARYLEWVDGPTTDHFVALKSSADPGSADALMLVYSWSNYRLAGGFVNGVKAAIATVLDPFSIEDGWFALNLGNFHTVVGPSAPAEQVDAIEHTIRALHLDRGPIVECRQRAARRYWHPPAGQPPIPFWSLEEDQPFLAAELRRQGMANPGD